MRHRMLALLVAACAGVSAAPAQARLVATLSAPNHHPRVGVLWPIRITARDPAGHPVRAEVRYQYLFNGTVVARRSHYRFRGTFRDTLEFPASAVGIRLVFRAVVTSAIGSRNLDWWVQVRR